MSFRINAITSHQNQPMYKHSNQNTSFKGGKFNVLKYALNPKKAVNINSIKAKLGLDSKVLENEVEKGIVNPILTVNSPLQRHRAGFLYRLSNRFCIDNFDSYNRNTEKLRTLLYDTYNTVKFPNKYHKNIVSHSGYNLENLNILFKDIVDDNQKLKLASLLVDIGTIYGSNKISFAVMRNILNTVDAKTMLKSYSKFEDDFISMVNELDPQNLPKALEDYVTKFVKK